MDNKKKIEITERQLAEVISEVVSSKHFVELTKASPVLMLAFAVFGAELTRTLFRKESKEEIKEESNE
jgi:hypothetical protein